MNKLRASLAGQAFEVLAVNLAESEPRIRRFMEQVPLDFPVLLDRDTAAAKAWQARILPASFIVGPDGRIRYSALGEIDWVVQRLHARINEPQAWWEEWTAVAVQVERAGDAAAAEGRT